MSNTIGKEPLHPAHAEKHGYFCCPFLVPIPVAHALYSMNRTQSQAVFFAQK